MNKPEPEPEPEPEKRKPPVCPLCGGLGGRYFGDPCWGTEGWEPCDCKSTPNDQHQATASDGRPQA